MKLLSNDLRVISWDRWEDSGDYPNNVAACALPSGPWEPDDTEGCGIYRLEEGDWEELQEAQKTENTDDFFADLQLDIGGEFKVNNLKIEGYDFKRVGEFLIVTPKFAGCASPCLVQETEKAGLD